MRFGLYLPMISEQSTHREEKNVFADLIRIVTTDFLCGYLSLTVFSLLCHCEDE